MSAHEPHLPSSGPPAEDAGSQALSEALKSSFFIVKIIMVILLLLFLGSGFFKVEPQFKAIVLRLGKPVGIGEKALLGPGLHWAFPPPIDQIEYIPFTSLQSADSSVGWYQSAEDRAHGVPGVPTGDRLNPASITYGLSADSNIVHVAATAQYRITDPISFHFDFTAAKTFITNDLNNALLYAASQMPIDDILTKKRGVFQEMVQEHIKELIDEQHLGVTIEHVNIDASPPLVLEPKFNEFDQAVLKREQVLNLALSYSNSVYQGSQGEATARVLAADAARKRTVELLAAQADIFQKLRGQYEQNPELFERIRQMRMLDTVYTNALDKMTLPPNTHEIRLQLSREPQAPNTNSYIVNP
ncbi:MAG TPA: SPFH domain-containing protein [Verrucomicrobiae bacterium]|jgi:membrane protease subunit HflK